MKRTIIGTIILSCLGIYFADYFTPKVAFDGPCGGWGIFETRCYVNQLIPIIIFSLIPFIIFKAKKTVSLVTGSVYLIFILLHIISFKSGTHFMFAYLDYRFPPVLGFWVGFYPVVIIIILNLVLLKVYPKYGKVGL